MQLSPRHVLASLALGTALCSAPALAEMTKSLNLNGTTGLIDMPSGDAQEDATFSFSMGNIGPITRTTLSFQASERLSASFRFQTWRDWDSVIPGDDKETDRSIDLRYQLVKEGRIAPAVTIGLIDLTSRGMFASEYIAATKTFGDRLKVTAGLGWGRLGSYQGIGAPFGTRPPVDPTGTPNADQWFRGEAAPFAGVEYRINDNWTLKGEYSSDAYLLEDGERGLIERDSPFNFGIEYQRGPAVRLGVYSLYGSEAVSYTHLVWRGASGSECQGHHLGRSPDRRLPCRSDGLGEDGRGRRCRQVEDELQAARRRGRRRHGRLSRHGQVTPATRPPPLRRGAGFELPSGWLSLIGVAFRDLDRWLGGSCR